MKKSLLVSLLLSFSLLVLLTSCLAIKDAAASGATAGLDNAASRPVLDALSTKNTDLANTITQEAHASAATGTSFPWLKAMLAHWDAIVATLGLGAAGVGWLSRGKQIVALAEQHQYLKAASEAMSLGIEISQAQGVPLVDALNHAATQVNLGTPTIRQAMSAGGASSAVLPDAPKTT